MILKLLLVIAVIWIVYTMFIKKKPLYKQKNTSLKEDVEDMVMCETCSVYCELSDSLLSDGKYYCSQECLEEAKI